MHLPASRIRPCAVVAVFLTALVPAVQAAPVAAGKRAVLTITVEIDGAGQRASRSDGVDVKWSTRRRFESKLEMVAGKLLRTSEADVKGRVAKAEAYKPSASMEAIQKEMAKCKPDDQACMIAVGMKAMQTDEAKQAVAESDKTATMPPRFQKWAVVSGSRPSVTLAEYQEQWEGVFLSASRETRSCKVVLPTTAALTAKDRESLGNGVKSIVVEIDTQTGKSFLLAAMGLYAQGKLNCHNNDGGRVEDTSETQSMNFGPPIDTSAAGNGGWVAGIAPLGGSLARGELSFDTKAEARSLTGMMSVTAPLKVKVRWQLMPL